MCQIVLDAQMGAATGHALRENFLVYLEDTLHLQIFGRYLTYLHPRKEEGSWSYSLRMGGTLCLRM